MNLRATQRGVATLVVSLLLLFGMTLAVFFVNRSMIFEQRTSANQYRSTKAFEAAEAGVEWAIGMLNGSRTATVDTSCALGAGTTAFRDQYVPSTLVGTTYDFTPVTTARPGCSMGSGAPACNCHSGATPPTTPAITGSNPSFTVQFTDTTDPETIQITSYGCTSAGSQCIPNAAASADGYARVQLMVKVRPNVRAVPAAALTTGGWAEICGSFNIGNLDPAANGNLVNSGSTITIGASTYQGGTLHAGETAPAACGGGGGQTLNTLPGTPLANTLITNDDSLWSLSSSTDAMFQAYFGMTLAQYKEQNSQCTVTGSNATSNASTVLSLYSDTTLKCRNFFIDGPIQFSGNGALGTSNDPISLVSPSSMTFNGDWDIYGLVYSDSANWNDNGTGTSNVYGAVVSRVNYKNNGNGSITYDANVLKKVREKGGLFVRVPGSWRDF